MNSIGFSLSLIATQALSLSAQTPAVRIGGRADESDRMAANEIVRCLSKMTGKDVGPATEGDVSGGGPKIILGRPDTSTAIQELAGELDLASLSPEGYLIRSMGSNIAIAANGPAGIVYGGYGFLEALGCRWYWPGKLGEVIPKRDLSQLPTLDIRQEPDFAIRWVGQSEWGRRNGSNVNVGMPDPAAELRLWGSYHSMSEMIPLSDFEQHPKWFALVNGRRWASPSRTQYCTSNPAVVKRCAEFICKLFDEDHTLNVVSLGVGDSSTFCECEACRSLDEPGRDSRGAHTRRHMTFFNQVAALVGERFPKRFIKIGAYSAYAEPPEDKELRLRDNIVLQFCHDSQYCYRHSIADPKCPNNAIYREYLDGWLKRAKHVTIYEYYWKASWAEIPLPIHRNIAHDINYFKSRGVNGLYTQFANDSRSGTPNHGTNGLNYYIAAKFLWDADADVDAVLDDYFRGMYGPAAEHMKAYYGELERAHSSGSSHLKGRFTEALEFYTPGTLDRCASHLDLAEKAADDEPIRTRISYARTQLDYTRALMEIPPALAAGDLPRCQEAHKRFKAILDRSENEPIFSKSARWYVGKSVPDRLLKTIGMEERDWIHPAADKLNTKLAFLLTENPTEDETEALRFARAHVSDPADLTVGNSSSFPALGSFRVVWIHSGADKLQDEFASPKAIPALKEFVRAGGRLFLSGDALLMANTLGLESTKATTGHHDRHFREIEIIPTLPDHPIFKGLPPRKFYLRTITLGEKWGEPRWTANDEVHGKVLATRRYPSEVIVEYELGKGKVIVGGTPFYYAFADRTNLHADKLTLLTRNILAYLAGR